MFWGFFNDQKKEEGSTDLRKPETHNNQMQCVDSVWIPS